ncbi:pollen receptor kinase 6 [Spatholobus suberectus]|nr:pollen receptor kinase 6 [Spatholobus suberectus]
MTPLTSQTQKKQASDKTTTTTTTTTTTLISPSSGPLFLQARNGRCSRPPPPPPPILLLAFFSLPLFRVRNPIPPPPETIPGQRRPLPRLVDPQRLPVLRHLARRRLLQQRRDGPPPGRPGPVRPNRRGRPGRDPRPAHPQLRQQLLLRPNPGVPQARRHQVPSPDPKPILRAHPLRLLLPTKLPQKSIPLGKQLLRQHPPIPDPTRPPRRAPPRVQLLLRPNPKLQPKPKFPEPLQQQAPGPHPRDTSKIQRRILHRKRRPLREAPGQALRHRFFFFFFFVVVASLAAEQRQRRASARLELAGEGGCGAGGGCGGRGDIPLGEVAAAAAAEGEAVQRGEQGRRRLGGGAGAEREGGEEGAGEERGDSDGERGEGVFGLPDLMKAAAEVLGNGGLGSAYKAAMASGLCVVVKRMREMNKIGRDVFDAEMRQFGRIRHRNVMTPLAYHYRREEKLFITEYMRKGSLLYVLHGDRGTSHAELTWPTRLKIVKGIARGLSFLYTEFSTYDLPHGNLKSSNVLLTDDYEPLLSDYAFHPLINHTVAVQALFAFKSPDYVQSQKVSQKTDVYCLGLIILEIVTGKFPSQYHSNGKGGTDAVQWVLTAISERREAELIDSELQNDTKSRNHMLQLLQIGAACTESNPEERLNMKEAIRRIEGVQV